MGLPFPFFFFPAYCEAGAWYSGNREAEVRMCGAADCAPPRAGLPERGAGAAAGMWEMQPRGREGCAQAAAAGRCERRLQLRFILPAGKTPDGKFAACRRRARRQCAILCLNARENSLSPRMAAAHGRRAALSQRFEHTSPQAGRAQAFPARNGTRTAKNS